METTAQAPLTQISTRKPAPQWLAYLAFTLVVSLYLLPFMRFIILVSDEGIFLTDAARIVHGQVFERDFSEVMGPGSLYWLAAFFKLFGATFLAARICLFVSSLGTALAMYFLTRRVCPRSQMLPCLILAATYFGAIWPGISHHVDSTFFALLAVCSLVLWDDKRRNSLLVSAGALAGIAACTLQPKGVLLLFMFIVWLWLQRRRIPSPLAAMGIVSGSFLLVLAAVAAYFWSKGALGGMIYDNFIFPTHNYSTVNSVAYGEGLLRDYWHFFVIGTGGARWSVIPSAILIAPLLFVAALPLLILGLAIGYIRHIHFKWNVTAPEISLYLLAGGAFWVSEIHRKDIYHLVFGSPLLIILCTLALTQSRLKLASLALQLLAITSSCLAAFNCILVLAAAQPLVTRAGTVHSFHTDPPITFLDEHVAPGDEVLIYPYFPTRYFLSATTNPTRYSYLLYNYNTPAQFQEVTATLEQRHVKYVVWDTTFFSKVTSAVMPGAQPTSPGGFIVEPYLESHYRMVENYQGVCIMERIADTRAK